MTTTLAAIHAHYVKKAAGHTTAAHAAAAAKKYKVAAHHFGAAEAFTTAALVIKDTMGGYKVTDAAHALHTAKVGVIGAA